MTARQLVDWMRARLPKEKKYPSGPEHRACERGEFCSTCASLVANNWTRETMEELLQKALEELDLEEKREIFAALP